MLSHGLLNKANILFAFCNRFGGMRYRSTHKFPDNEPAAAIIIDIIRHPVNEHDNAVARAHQREQVYEYPYQPGKKSLELDLAQVGNVLIAANSCQRSLFVIFERLCWLAFYQMNNVFTHVFTHLYGYLCYARVSFWRFVGYHGGHIANGKHVFSADHTANVI